MDLDLPDHQAARSWAGTEFATLDCSDARRCRRFVRVASDFIRNPAAAIPAACGDWAGTKACYRLFDQPEVNSGAILAAHRAAMLERLRAVDGGGTLLVLQDATSLNYDNHRSKEGLGPTAGHGKDRSPGIFVHGQLVACTDGAVHGLASALVYARQPRGAGEPAGKRNRQPLKEKESYRWVGGWHEAQRLWALEVRKIDPPPGVEPVCWQLLTTEPVADAADAARLVGWYALRWRIEDFHRVLKTG